jgi:hypothetical protein
LTFNFKSQEQDNQTEIGLRLRSFVWEGNCAFRYDRHRVAYTQLSVSRLLERGRREADSSNKVKKSPDLIKKDLGKNEICEKRKKIRDNQTKNLENRAKK